MEKLDLKQITQNILSDIPQNTLLNEQDIQVLKKNKDFINSHLNEIVKDFYDTVFSNENTKNVFKPGEREIREKSLAEWFKISLDKDFDLNYWAWQTFVGILHVKRKVKNSMMIAMMGRISSMLYEQAIKELPQDDAIAFIKAWTKLSTTVLSLIAESYHIFYLKAINESTGLSPALLENAVQTEIDNLIKENAKFRIIQ